MTSSQRTREITFSPTSSIVVDPSVLNTRGRLTAFLESMIYKKYPAILPSSFGKTYLQPFNIMTSFWFCNQTVGIVKIIELDICLFLHCYMIYMSIARFQPWFYLPKYEV